MTANTKKALMVYALGAFCVVLGVGAGLAHYSYTSCTAKGGQWSFFSCSK